MTEQALLVFTDASLMLHVEAESHDLPCMALRGDQLKANQMLFFDARRAEIGFVALLHAAQPFIPQPDGSYRPNVVEYMELMEPIEVDPRSVCTAGELGIDPTKNIVGYLVDPFEIEADPTYLHSQVVDEMVLNGRNPNQQAVRRTLLGNKRVAFHRARTMMVEVVAA